MRIREGEETKTEMFKYENNTWTDEQIINLQNLRYRHRVQSNWNAIQP